ncbi:MAG: DsbA family protein [Anaerolineales bacterium]|nr:DsbA family protein [Anaerolineales bacterium]
MSFYRKAAEHRQRQARQKRLAGIAIVAGLSLVVVAVLVFQSLASAPNPDGALVTAEAAAYPQANGKAMGPAGAPVVVQEFSDFQCPYCRMFHEEIQAQLVERYVANGAGRVRFEYHHFIIIDGNVGGVESRHAAIASECANEQGGFWQFHALLFANQAGEGRGAFSDTRLGQLAGTAGLNTSAFAKCFTSSAAANAVIADEQLARQYALNSTPSLLVNGQKVANPLDFAQVTATIDAALAAAQ